MKFLHPIPVTEIAQQINATIYGNRDLLAFGINEIHKVELGDITFSDVEKYFEKSLNSEATIIILNKRVDCPEGKVILVVDKPFDAYNSIVQKHRPFVPLTSMIDPSAQIGPRTIIEPNVIIGNDVVIGSDCYIQAGAIIQDHCIIGNHVTIQSGTVIGSDAFYYKKEDSQYRKWHSGGRVLIHDHVEIGANCTINKGVSGDTVIGEGSKFDCMIHIGHGAVIGKNCLLAAQVGIGGKTIIGDNVTLYGQVGIAQNLEIGNNVTVLAKSGISKNIPENKVYFGYPAKEAKSAYKEIAALKNLPEFMKANLKKA